MLATARSLLWLITTALCSQRYDHYDEFVKEEGGPENVETAQKIYPYAKMVLYVLYAIRFFINIASLKWPKILKAYFYIEMCGVMVESFIPNDVKL